MKNWITVIALLAWTSAEGADIENRQYRVTLDPEASVFAVEAKATNQTFVSEGILSEAVDAAERKGVSDETWGTGQALSVVYENGDEAIFAVFDELPFVLYRSTLINRTDAERVVQKEKPFELDMDLDAAPNALRTISTAGLRDADNGTGGYMFMAAGNPETLTGAVVGWLTTDRGSGIVQWRVRQGRARMAPHIDYGDLRIPAGERVVSESVLIGYGDDIRFALEAYAGAVAKHYAISLPEQPGVYGTWYHANASTHEELMKNAAFAREELKPFGLGVMQIDDRWQGDHRNVEIEGRDGHNGPHKVFTDPGPEGWYTDMAETAEGLGKNGFTPGLWFMPFSGTWNHPFFADKQDLFFQEDGEPYEVFWGGTQIDMSNPRSRAFLRDNISRFIHEWGYRYLKLDGLFCGLGVRIRHPNTRYIDDNLGETERHDPMMTPVEIYRMGLDIIRETAGVDVYLLGCTVAQNQRTLGASFGLVDAMRVGADNSQHWVHWRHPEREQFTMRVGVLHASRVYFLNGRVWHNDPDPMYVREEVPLHKAQTLASWVALSGMLNESSEAYYELSEKRLNIIRRTLPAHGSLNVRPVDYLENEPAQIWLLSERVGDRDHHVVGLFNWNDDEGEGPWNRGSTAIDYPLERMGLDPDADYVGFDYWANEFILPVRERLRTKLDIGECRIWSLRETTDYPQVVGTSRHVTQGIIDLLSERWDGEADVLTGISHVVENDPYEIRIVIPEGDAWEVREARLQGAPDEATIDYERNGTELRVTIRSPKSDEIEWKLVY